MRLEDIGAVAAVKSERERRRTLGLALRIATTAVGVRELGDLTPATTAETVREAMGTRAPGIVRAILNAQGVRYGAAVNLTPKDWGLKRYRVRKKSDPTFAWAVVRDPTLDLWRRYLTEWLADRPVKSKALTLGEFFLNYLLANPSVTSNPEEFCRRTYLPTVPYRDWLEARHKNQRALLTPTIAPASSWTGCWTIICPRRMTSVARFAARSTGTRSRDCSVKHNRSRPTAKQFPPGTSTR